MSSTLQIIRVFQYELLQNFAGKIISTKFALGDITQLKARFAY